MSISATSAAARAGRRPVWTLVIHQFRYDLRSFLRDRQSRFFTLALPVLFLVIFCSVFGTGTVRVPGGTIKESTYYVPGLVALGIISASFVNLVISITAQRESGILKRRRSTPVPAWVLIAGRALTAVVTAAAIAVLLVVIGWAAYGAHLPGRTIPAIVVAIVLGSVTFCVLGYALVSVIGSADSAQPVVQAVILPLYFISGIFIPSDIIPNWLTSVARVFPVYHLQRAMLAAFNPHTTGAGFAWRDMLVLGIWGLAGLFIAVRRFSWQPKTT
jgi:ABC-2 type transport system permease protein